MNRVIKLTKQENAGRKRDLTQHKLSVPNELVDDVKHPQFYRVRKTPHGELVYTPVSMGDDG